MCDMDDDLPEGVERTGLVYTDWRKLFSRGGASPGSLPSVSWVTLIPLTSSADGAPAVFDLGATEAMAEHRHLIDGTDAGLLAYTRAVVWDVVEDSR